MADHKPKFVGNNILTIERRPVKGRGVQSCELLIITERLSAVNANKEQPVLVQPPRYKQSSKRTSELTTRWIHY